jgi:hypothetical protein
VRDGRTPDITPGWITIVQNLIVGNYNANQAVDNDDGSSYWKTTDNVLVYGASSGLKADFGGHDLIHMRNLYLFPGSCGVLALGLDSFSKAGHACVFAENACVLGPRSQYIGGFTCANHSVEEVARGAGYTYIPGSIDTGHNSSVSPRPITVAEAKRVCNASAACFGFSYHGGGAAAAAAATATADVEKYVVVFKPCVAQAHRRSCDWIVTAGSQDGGWSSYTKGPAETMPTVWGNEVFTDSGEAASLRISCYNDTSRLAYAPHSEFTMTEWQKLGHSAGDTVQETPSTSELLGRARKILSLS